MKTGTCWKLIFETRWTQHLRQFQLIFIIKVAETHMYDHISFIIWTSWAAFFSSGDNLNYSCFFFLRIKAVWAKKSWYTNWIFSVLVRKEKKMFIIYYNIVLFCFHLLLGHFHEVVVLWDLMGPLLWVIFCNRLE